MRENISKGNILYFKQNIKDTEFLKTIHCLQKVCASFYNKCLYIHLENNKKGLGFKNYIAMEEMLKNDSNYKLLGSNIARSVIRNLEVNYSNFFKNARQSRNLQSPRFRNISDEFFVSFFGVRVNSTGNITLTLTKELKDKFGLVKTSFKVAERFLEFGVVIKQLRLHHDYVVYHYEKEFKTVEGCYKAGIDLGVDNLITLFSTNPIAPSYVFKGGYLKFTNYKFLMKKDMGSKDRTNLIDSYFNRCVRALAKYCFRYGVTSLCIGDFKHIKKKHRATNFFYIPFLRLKLKIRDMCKKYGIKVIFTEESYTSKTSFLLKEEMRRSDNYYGYRAKRGLYKVKGSTIAYNCDINGAANIIRKAYKTFENSSEFEDCFTNVLKNPKVLKAGV